MSSCIFARNKAKAVAAQKAAVSRKNRRDTAWFNGLYDRYLHPVATRENIPVDWRCDMNPKTNPLFIERLGINAVFNAGAMELNGKIVLVCRVEGLDLKCVCVSGWN